MKRYQQKPKLNNSTIEEINPKAKKTNTITIIKINQYSLKQQRHQKFCLHPEKDINNIGGGKKSRRFKLKQSRVLKVLFLQSSL